MGVYHYWYLERRIYYVQLVGLVQETDAVRSDAQALHTLTAINAVTPLPTLHVIVDFSHLDDLRISLTSAVQLLTGSTSRQGLMQYFGNGYSIDVGFKPHHKINKFINAVLHQRDNVRFRQVNTLADAVQFLNYVDSTLPPLPVLTVEQMIPLVRVGENMSAEG